MLVAFLCKCNMDNPYRILPAVTEIAEQHFVLVGVVFALGADLTFGTLPVVVGHIL